MICPIHQTACKKSNIQGGYICAGSYKRICGAYTLYPLCQYEDLETAQLVGQVYVFFEFDHYDYEDMGYGHDRRYKNLNACKTRLRRKGLVEQIHHGRWRITEKGRCICAQAHV